MPTVAFTHRFPRGALGVTIGKQTTTITFQKHIYTTHEQEVVDALMNHPQYGKTFKRIESAEEYVKVKQHAAQRDTRYQRGAATTVDPRHTPVVTDPVDSVISDEGPFGDAAAPVAKKPVKRTTKKRSR